MTADIWKATTKGSATVWTHPRVSGAVVDRHGMGMAGALGASITYRGMAFGSVREAKIAALRACAKDTGRD